MRFDLQVFLDILRAMPWGVWQTLCISFLSFLGALVLAFAVAMIDYAGPASNAPDQCSCSVNEQPL